MDVGPLAPSLRTPNITKSEVRSEKNGHLPNIANHSDPQQHQIREWAGETDFGAAPKPLRPPNCIWAPWGAGKHGLRPIEGAYFRHSQLGVFPITLHECAKINKRNNME